MKTCETQILKPRVKLTLFDISVWPLKNYDLSYESNKRDIVQAYKTGKIRALKEGKAKITCKNSDKSIYATFDVEVKCDHFKKLIKAIDSSCSKKGKIIYKCDICKMQFESIIETKPHDFEYELINKNSGKTKGTCKNCKAIINFNAPTEFEISWRNDETTKKNIYSNYLPENNPVGSLIIGFSKTNGDENYRELIFELDDEDLIERKEEKIESDFNFKIIAKGTLEITVYPKYNPNLKKTFELELGN